MYLVDGNNVIGQRVGWHRNKPAAQRRLLCELSAWSRRQHESAAAVVFDGNPPDGMRKTDNIDGIAVFFASPASADKRIIDLVRKAPNREKLVAVTSDRQLGNALIELGIRTIRSGVFRKLLEEEC